MRESEYMVRNTNGTIDAHKSIHAFAMAIGRQLQEEASVKRDRKLKRAILQVLNNNPGVPLTSRYVVLTAAHHYATHNHMDVSSGYADLERRIELHIKLNSGNGGYLQVIKGARGGLFRKVRP